MSYGTETGLFGAAEPDNLRPMLWRDLRYEDDAGHPAGAARKADPVRFDEELLKYFQALGKARAAQPALRRGTTETVLADESRRVYAFARILDDDRVVAAFNLTEKEQALEVPLPGEQARDLISGRKLRGRDGKVSVVLLPVLGRARGRGSAAGAVARPRTLSRAGSALDRCRAPRRDRANRSMRNRDRLLALLGLGCAASSSPASTSIWPRCACSTKPIPVAGPRDPGTGWARATPTRGWWGRASCSRRSATSSSSGKACSSAASSPS